MPPARTTRGAQPTSSGLGLHFVSPKKSRDVKKTQAFVNIPGVNAKHKRLLDQMATLMNPLPVLHTENLSSVSTPPQSEAPMSIDDANYDDLTDYIYDANSDDYVVTADQPDQPLLTLQMWSMRTLGVASCQTGCPITSTVLGRHLYLPWWMPF